MVKEHIVIWGASGHAMVVADIIRLRRKFSIYGFIDDINPDRKNEMFSRERILGGTEVLDTLEKGVHRFIIAIGDCKARIEKARIIKQAGFDLISAIHPSSIIASDVLIGEGSVIAAGAVINPGCKIGDNVIINTSAVIDHECVINDGSHICPGANLAGNVTIGESSWIGIGSIIKEKIRIGNNSFIGAGSLVLKDIPDNVVAFGSPAKVMKSNE